MTNKKPLMLFILTILILIIQLTPSLAWWNSSWLYRKPINISNTAGDLTNYQIPIYFGEKPITDKLVGYWKFNEGSGTTTRDSSGYGNSGNLTGSLTWISGVSSSALDFPGSDGNHIIVSHSSSLNIVNQIIIATWIKGQNNQLAENIYLVGKQSAYAMRIATGGTPNFGMILRKSDNSGWNSLSSGLNYLDNKWHYLVATYDNSKIRLYADGNSVDTSGSIGDTIYTTPTSLLIGAYTSTYGPFDGSMDEVKIYNKSLSETDIKHQFCIGAYRLNQTDTFSYPS
jgi:hypothetical protein